MDISQVFLAFYEIIHNVYNVMTLEFLLHFLLGKLVLFLELHSKIVLKDEGLFKAILE